MYFATRSASTSPTRTYQGNESDIGWSLKLCNVTLVSPSWAFQLLGLGQNTIWDRIIIYRKKSSLFAWSLPVCWCKECGPRLCTPALSSSPALHFSYRRVKESEHWITIENPSIIGLYCAKKFWRHNFHLIRTQHLDRPNCLVVRMVIGDHKYLQGRTLPVQ